MKEFESNGAKLSYVETGDGLPVVFLHPTPLDHDYWRPLVDELAHPRESVPSRATTPVRATTPLRAIVPDLRGHGASELGSGLPVGGFARVPDAPVLTMQQLASDVLTLLDKLAVSEAVFVGCSIGGYILFELWRQAPERIRGLAFVCSKPQPDAEPALVKRAANIAIAGESGVSELFDGMAKMLIGETTRQRRPEVLNECRARMTLTTEAFAAVQAGLATRPDSVATVASIQRPVLAIAGGEDTAVSPTEMEAFRAAPGGCESYVIADVGHFAAYEQPLQVAALFRAWLHQFGD